MLKLLSSVLDFFNPAGLAFKLLIYGAIAGVVAFGVHKYNDGIREEAVAAALKDERAETQPVIDELKQRVADRDATISAKDAAFKTEHDRQTAEAAGKQKLYNEVVKQNANLSKQIQNNIVAADALAGQLRDITTRSRSACTGDGDYQRRLGDALASCETDLNRQLRAAEEAASIAAGALAAARALRSTN